MTMKALVQGAGSAVYFGRSTDTIPFGSANFEMFLTDIGKMYTGKGTGTGMASWQEQNNAAYVTSPLMVAAVAISGSYADLVGIPADFTPSAHDHLISEVTGLQTDLDGKAAVAHNHAAGDTNSGTFDDARIPALAISKTTGLQAAIDGKFSNPAGSTSQYLRGDGSTATFPAIPAAQVNADWAAGSGLAQILNKPAIPVILFGSPVSRTITAATAYQATTNTKPAVVTLNLTSSAALSLAVGVTNSADIVIGSTNGVAGGTGTVVGKYTNSLTGTLIIGLAITTASASPITFALPIGWFWALRVTSGAVTVTSAYDQSVG